MSSMFSELEIRRPDGVRNWSYAEPDIRCMCEHGWGDVFKRDIVVCDLVCGDMVVDVVHPIVLDSICGN